MSQVNLSIIGYGIMGERLLRAALEHARTDIKVAGVWDPSPKAMERLAADLPEVPRLVDFKQAIAAADCVYVASPPSSHLDYAGRAVAAGRAVFCEKPLAVDVEAASAFADYVFRHRARVAVNFPFASSPAVAQIKKWLAMAEVGQMKSLTISADFAHWPRPWQRDAAGWLAHRAEGGFTREVLSHFLFLARRVLGPLALIEAETIYPPGDGSETEIAAHLTAHGLPVNVKGRVGVISVPETNLWQLEGDMGGVRLRDWSIAERQDGGGHWVPAAGLNQPIDRIRAQILTGQLAGVAAMTRGQAHRLATVAEAFEVQAIVEAILSHSAKK